MPETQSENSTDTADERRELSLAEEIDAIAQHSPKVAAMLREMASKYFAHHS